MSSQEVWRKVNIRAVRDSGFTNSKGNLDGFVKSQILDEL